MNKSRFYLSITFFLLMIFSSFGQNQSEKSKCNLCDTLPGKISEFEAALIDSKLHYYTNNGKTKLDLKKAEEVCDANYFYTCNNLMVLISTGHKNDRTEIRQDKNLSLNDYSAMYFKGKFENAPDSNERKGVTIGQIHNDTKGVKRPLLRVEIAGGNAIKVIVTDSYIKNEGNVENDFFTSFKNKDEVECKIEINESDDKVTVYVKNITQNKAESKTYNVSDLWKEMDGNFYFKAGAYTQVSGPKTKVSYSKFQFIYE
ncbi:polysaccharide lyase family 7 protein [Polaribacter vadi]|uniref:polysaccharide lyase family 7 protein n=1 Tax=Polaribacter TaxID=52959 RepID=UPI001C0979CD|nr:MULTISPECIES: polysaccharide lyase family 7 protein [Polaribacter]MBU3010573.1 polysaccharide lyase family 7 protein [Polaribacter vadi]MDO6740384.1 polysaccharide lyase family 7 protein [Polaribacter sp. 1_MG-2023]